jgi:hypothetical protein
MLDMEIAEKLGLFEITATPARMSTRVGTIEVFVSRDWNHLGLRGSSGEDPLRAGPTPERLLFRPLGGLKPPARAGSLLRGTLYCTRSCTRRTERCSAVGVHLRLFSGAWLN